MTFYGEGVILKEKKEKDGGNRGNAWRIRSTGRYVDRRAENRAILHGLMRKNETQRSRLPRKNPQLRHSFWREQIEKAKPNRR